MTYATTVSEALNKAADEIETKGLHKGALWSDSERPLEGPCCALGAIDRATGVADELEGSGDAAWRLDREASDFMRAYIGGVSLAEWSDSRRKEAVVFTFRQASSAAKALGL